MKQNLKAAWNSLVFTLNLVAESGLWLFGILIAVMFFATSPIWSQVAIGLILLIMFVVFFQSFKELDKEKENNDQT